MFIAKMQEEPPGHGAGARACGLQAVQAVPGPELPLHPGRARYGLPWGLAA